MVEADIKALMEELSTTTQSTQAKDSEGEKQVPTNVEQADSLLNEIQSLEQDFKMVSNQIAEKNAAGTPEKKQTEVIQVQEKLPEVVQVEPKKENLDAVEP